MATTRATRFITTAVLPRVNETATDAGLGPAPAWLSEPQRAIWRDAIASAPSGLLLPCDASVVLVWVVAADNRRQAITTLNQLSPEQITEARILRKIARKQATIMAHTERALRFTPRSDHVWPR